MRYVEFKKTETSLTMYLNRAGREFVAELVENHGDDYLSTDAALFDLLEWQLCNGWESIRPEEVGALTDAPIIADDVLRDDDGEIVDLTTVYWFPNYAILSPARELRDCGKVSFTAA